MLIIVEAAIVADSNSKHPLNSPWMESQTVPQTALPRCAGQKRYYFSILPCVSSVCKVVCAVLWVILRILQKELSGTMNAGLNGRGAAVCHVCNLLDGIPLHTQDQGGAVDWWHLIENF